VRREKIAWVCSFGLPVLDAGRPPSTLASQKTDPANPLLFGCFAISTSHGIYDVGDFESSFEGLAVTRKASPDQKTEGGAVPSTYWGAPLISVELGLLCTVPPQGIRQLMLLDPAVAELATPGTDIRPALPICSQAAKQSCFFVYATSRSLA